MTKLMLVALDSDKELRVKVDVLGYSMGGVFFFFLKNHWFITWGVEAGRGKYTVPT